MRVRLMLLAATLAVLIPACRTAEEAAPYCTIPTAEQFYEEVADEAAAEAPAGRLTGVVSAAGYTAAYDLGTGRFSLSYEGVGAFVVGATVTVTTGGNVASSTDPAYARTSILIEDRSGAALHVHHESSQLPVFDVVLQIPADGGGVRVTVAGSAEKARVVGRVLAGDDPLIGRPAPESPSRVFGLTSGPANSANATCLFNRGNDTAVYLGMLKNGRFVHEAGTPPDRYYVVAEGPPHEPVVELALLTDVIAGHGVPVYEPIDRSVFTEAPCGWCTWYYYYQGITETEWDANVVWLGDNLRQYGLEWVQIDDGWQMANGSLQTTGGRDWRAHNEKFPSGMKHVADVCHENGLRAGIWLIPQKTDSDEVYEAHQECFLHYPDGAPVRIADWNPGGVKQYVIDPTHPRTMPDYYLPFWRMLSDEWGFDYFKIDNQPEQAGWYDDTAMHLRHDMAPSGRDVYRMTIQAIKDVIGPSKYLLGCYGIPLHGIGIMNGSRTGGDMVANWSGCQVMIDTICRWNFLNNTCWWCDPDTLCVRDPLTLDEARLMTTLVSLSGEALMTSDKMYELPAERVEILRRACPTVDIRPMEFYPWRGSRPEVFDLKLVRPWGEWDVVAVYNWGEGVSKTEVTWGELGIAAPPDTRFHVYDFWEQRYLGHYSDGISLQLPRHGCRVLSVTEDMGHPQVISTSRHLTQGAVDIIDVRWDGREMCLSGRSRLVGGDPYAVVVALPQFPERYVASRALADCAIEVADAGPVARLTMRPGESMDARWQVWFNVEPGQSEAEMPLGFAIDVDSDPGRYILSWEPAAGAFYRVHKSGLPVAEVWENTWTDVGLPPGESIAYSVTSVGHGGAESHQSDWIFATSPMRVTVSNLLAAAAEPPPPGGLGDASMRVAVAAGETATLSLPALPPDRYRTRVLVARWQNMGKLTVTAAGAVLLPAFDTAADVETPTFEWVDMADTDGGELELSLSAEDGPVAVLNASRTSRSFVVNWHVCGPFDNARDEGFDRAYPPETAEDPLSAEGCDWSAMPAGPSAALDLRAVADRDWVANYAYAVITASADLSTRMLLGSDDGVKVWLNGELVHSNLVHRGVRVDEDAFDVHLVEGENRLLVKVTNGGGPTGLALRILDPDGLLAH